MTPRSKARRRIARPVSNAIDAAEVLPQAERDRPEAAGRSCRNGGMSRAHSGQNARHRDLPTSRDLSLPRTPCGVRGLGTSISANAGVDQLGEVADRLRGDDAGGGVKRKPRHLVLGGHHALQHRHEALHVEQLVERRADIAGLQPVDRSRGEVDAAKDDLAGLLASLLQRRGMTPVTLPCCRPIAFRFGCD